MRNGRVDLESVTQRKYGNSFFIFCTTNFTTKMFIQKGKCM